MGSSKLLAFLLPQKRLELQPNHHEHSYLNHSFPDCHCHCCSRRMEMWKISWLVQEQRNVNEWRQKRLIIENNCWHSRCNTCPIHPFGCRKGCWFGSNSQWKRRFHCFCSN